MARRSIACATYCAVEMAAGDRHVAALAVLEHQRVVGRGIHLGADDALDIFDRLDGRAVNLRRAAQRIDVLHARADGLAGLARLVGKDDVARRLRAALRSPSMRRRLRATRAWPGCGRACCTRGSKAASSPRIASSDSAHGDVGLLEEPARILVRERGEGERDGRAVDERRGFLRAQRRNPARSRPSRMASGAGIASALDTRSRLPRSRRPRRP